MVIAYNSSVMKICAQILAIILANILQEEKFLYFAEKKSFFFFLYILAVYKHLAYFGFL